MMNDDAIDAGEQTVASISLWPFIAAGLAILASGGVAWAVFGPSIFLDALSAGWTACFG